MHTCIHRLSFKESTIKQGLNGRRPWFGATAHECCAPDRSMPWSRSFLVSPAMKARPVHNVWAFSWQGFQQLPLQRRRSDIWNVHWLKRLLRIACAFHERPGPTSLGSLYRFTSASCEGKGGHRSAARILRNLACLCLSIEHPFSSVRGESQSRSELRESNIFCRKRFVNPQPRNCR